MCNSTLKISRDFWLFFFEKESNLFRPIWNTKKLLVKCTLTICEWNFYFQITGYVIGSAPVQCKLHHILQAEAQSFERRISFVWVKGNFACSTTTQPNKHSRTYLVVIGRLEIKFGFSDKATKFEKIFVVLLTTALCPVRATAYLSKSWQRFFKTNMVKLYYTNFTDTTIFGGKKSHEE